jgi:hypothetical protein
VGKTMTKGQASSRGATKPVGVTDAVLASIDLDLAKQKVALADHELHLPRLLTPA